MIGWKLEMKDQKNKKMNSLNFIEAKKNDLSIILNIYNYYIESTTTTFYYDKLSLDDFKKFIFINHNKYKTFLIYQNKKLAGFCFITQFRKKAAYDKTAEIGIYLIPGYTRRGIGKEVVKYLVSIAKKNHIEVILASISGENITSIKLFKNMKYKQCAHYKGIATKFGRKLDFIDFQKIYNLNFFIIYLKWIIIYIY